ncbi:MAG: LysM peptidoglycan-binding domain-containing protein, partial [Chloroflexota bacterium]
MTKKKLNINDYKTFKSIQVNRGDSIWRIARHELPVHLRTDSNINALTQQILKINGLTIQSAKTMLPGRKLIVPDILGQIEGSSGEMRYTVKKGDTLGKLASYFYQRKKGQRLSALANRVRLYSKNAQKNLPKNINAELPEGLEIVLPGVDHHVGEMVEVPYNFYRPELWLRRWVSVMRSLKSTLLMFREAIVDISDLTNYDVEVLAAALVERNGLEINKDLGDDLPQTRNGFVQLMLDDLRQRDYKPVAEDETLDELSSLLQQISTSLDDLNQLEYQKEAAADQLGNLEAQVEASTYNLDSLNAAITEADQKLAALKAELAKAEQELSSRAGSTSDGGGLLSSMRQRLANLFGGNDLLEPTMGFEGETPTAVMTIQTPGETQPATSAVEPWATPIDPTQLTINTWSEDGPRDPEFELKQLLNLYVLTWNLLVFVDEALGPRIASSLPGRWQAKHFRKHPPINLVAEALRRASTDIEIVQRAVVQRKRELDRTVHQLTRQGESLLIMDKLTKMALAPFQHLISSSDAGVNPITYFSEKTHIRRVPYAPNTLLVGIAYAFASYHQDDLKAYTYLLNDVPDADQKRFWPSYEIMAIPHEVGHFIYHHAQDPATGESMAALTADRAKTDKFGRWYEEIFADVYGCFISGPLTALGMQGLLAGSSVRNMSLDDGEHPVPIFRPFIISEILRELSKLDDAPYDFQSVPDALDENWEKILRLRGHLPQGTADYKQVAFTFAQAEGDHRDHFDEARQRVAPSVQARIVVETTIREVLDEVRPMIKVFVSHLAQNVKFEPWGVYESDLEGDQPDVVTTQIDEDGNVSGNMMTSPGIPWSKNDYADLNRYDEDIKQLTSKKVFRRKIPRPTVMVGEELSLPDTFDPNQLPPGVWVPRK